MKFGFVIPVYRHGKSACSAAKRLAEKGLPVIMVDDGNNEETKKILEDGAASTRGVVLVRQEKNGGKGSAVVKGVEKAKEIGLSHVLQIDADGQHDFEKVDFFLEQSAAHPDMIVCGYSEFDSSVPKSRLMARKISVFWAVIVTFSKELKDLLCGFRVYPIDPFLQITNNTLMDKRMGFDVEILVRLYWKRVYPLYFPVKVIYPEGGVSNFRTVRDNMRISLVYARLCIGMFFRLPLLITNKIRRRKEK